MTSPSRPADNLLLATVLSFVPWAAFLGALLVAGWRHDEDPALSRVAAVAPLCLLVVALPSGAALAAAGSRGLRIVVLAVMTAVSAGAAFALVASDDAQAGLAVLWVPIVAFPLAAVVGATRLALERRPGLTNSEGTLAATSERVAALVVDTVAIGGVLVVPLTWLSHAGLEVAAVVAGLGLATLALGLPVWRWGSTLGHTLLGLGVVDRTTLGPVGLGRSLVRGLLVAAETMWLMSLLPLIDLMLVAATRRSGPDRLLRTTVVRTR